MKHAKSSPKPKEKMRFGTKMVILSMGGMVSYTLLLALLAILDIFLGTDIQMPSDWNGYVFAFLTVEIVSIAALRMPEKVKSKSAKDDEKEKNDEQRGSDTEADQP